MEMLLIGVTLVSLALATSLAAVAWKLIRDHHRFAAARVDALMALATGDEPLDDDVPGTPLRWPGDIALTHAERTALTFDLPLATTATGTPMFGGAAAPGVGRRRSLALVMAGLLLTAAGGTLYALHASGGALLSTVLRAASRPETAAGTSPLELRALQYTIDDAGAFVVAGVVMDPAGGRALEDVSAVVYLFDEDGTCFANGRAAIEVATLRPGDDSSFEVRVPATKPVTRYRVGFRRADGSTIGHVDKRSGPR